MGNHAIPQLPSNEEPAAEDSYTQFQEILQICLAILEKRIAMLEQSLVPIEDSVTPHLEDIVRIAQIVWE